jgi:hypothetical protein
VENNNNSLDGIVESLKKNSDLIKGGAAFLLGAYFISLKYYVVIDFLLFAAGVLLVFYGFTCCRVAGLPSLFRYEWFSSRYWSNRMHRNDDDAAK